MPPNTVYLITGANRGIGRGLAAAILQRSNTTVIATYRPKVSCNTSTAQEHRKSDRPPSLFQLPSSLTDLNIGPGSSLIPVPLDSTSGTDFGTLISTLSSSYITHIDVVIANAGSGTSFLSTLTTPTQALRDDFEVNTLGPIKLFQALHAFLSASSSPKFVLISSSLGSIAAMEDSIPSLSYGVSKAGANYVVRKIHFECENITSFAVHPGWVKTANGQNFADAIGIQEPPMSLEESVGGVLAQIDGATKEGTSGTFVSYDGALMPW